MMHGMFQDQYSKMVNKIIMMAHLSIGTLGPETTSSYQALAYYISNLSKRTYMDYKTILYDTFDECLEAIVADRIDLALVPSAYGQITKFFWNPNLKNIYTFSFPTPEYGIVSRAGYDLKQNKRIRVASCEPVKFLLNILLNEEMALHEPSILITPSTTKALEAMLEGRADIAITNRTSFLKYADTYEIEFITDCFNTQMIWCVFAQKGFIKDDV